MNETIEIAGTLYHARDGKALLDEDGSPIPTTTCVCSAWKPSECICGAWDDCTEEEIKQPWELL